MKFIRKLFGLTPKVGDTVKGYVMPGVQYDGIVVEVLNYEIVPGVIVDGVTTISTDWNGNISNRHPRIFVPMSKVIIV